MSTMVSYLAYPGLNLSDVSNKQMMSILRGVKGQNPTKILHAVCEYYGEPLSKVVSKSRKREYSWCRHVFFYFCVRFTSMTKDQIAQFVGRKDHATTINGEQTVQDILETEPDKIRDLKEIEYRFTYGPVIGEKQLIPSK